ncbi:MAG: PAS domain-containing protein [Bacteroidales bacterium]|nr:PAS domain-containing protein [Bacteroidales bacterium]
MLALRGADEALDRWTPTAEYLSNQQLFIFHYQKQKNIKMEIDYQKHEVPEEYLEKWQKTVDLMARLFEVSAGLIMRVGPEQIEVLVSSQSEGNPYKRSEKADLGTGLYCETVMESRSQLQVPNALQDEDWKDKPDVKIDMISYLGIPLIWPDDKIFGTICVLERKTRNFSKLYQSLLWEFKGIIEGDFRIIQQNQEIKQENTYCKQAETALQHSHDELELRVQERTAQLSDSNIQLQQEIYERKRADEMIRQQLDELDKSRHALLSILEDAKRSEEALKESERRLKESQQVARIGQWDLDIVTKQLYWSDGMYDLFEVDPDKFTPSLEAFDNVILPEERDFLHKAYFESVKNKTPYDIIHRLLLKDGTIKYVNEICRTEYDKDGNAIRSIGTIQDITELKRAEEELKKHRDHLEELVKERTKELQAANQELEAFSYSVSHDLRAPLRAINGFSEILSSDYRDQLDEEAKRLINVIRKNTQDMSQLITDLLDFSRLGRQQLKTVKIDMKALVRKIFDELKEIYPKRNIEFKLGEIPPATGDRNLVRLVFVNLISNAIKFTEPGKIARIEIGSLQKNKQLFYYVKDNGVGFKMDYIGKIFKVFQRLHSSEEFEGTGVGLAIVQKIIHKHGGEVIAEGEVNKGATFYFSLQKE